MRRLDDLSQQPIFAKGAKLGPGLGRLFIHQRRNGRNPKTQFPLRPIIKSSTAPTNYQAKRSPVILVTKDVNLRMKAKAVGIQVEDYTNDKINVDVLQDSGIRTIEDLPSDLLQRLYEEGGFH